MLLSKIMALFFRDLPFGGFISFVADQNDRRVRVAVLIYLLKPEGDVLERLGVGEVKHNEDAMSPSS